MTQREQPLDCTLTQAESAEVAKQASPVCDLIRGDPQDIEEILAAARYAHQQMPERVLTALHADSPFGGTPGARRLRGLPLGDLPATPATRAGPPWPALPGPASVQLALCAGLGEPVSYREEKDGALIQDIYAIPGDEERQENSGLTDLELHTEDAFHRCPPDVVSLLCLKPDPLASAVTGVACIRAVAGELSGRDAAILRRPLFHIMPSSSFAIDGPLLGPVGPLPLLTDGPEGPELTVDTHGLIAPDEESRLAAQRLAGKLHEHASRISLDSGDLLLINNRTSAHFRTAYSGAGGTERRWLRRLFVVSEAAKRRIVAHASGRALSWSAGGGA